MQAISHIFDDATRRWRPATLEDQANFVPLSAEAIERREAAYRAERLRNVQTYFRERGRRRERATEATHLESIRRHHAWLDRTPADDAADWAELDAEYAAWAASGERDLLAELQATRAARRIAALAEREEIDRLVRRVRMTATSTDTDIEAAEAAHERAMAAWRRSYDGLWAVPLLRRVKEGFGSEQATCKAAVQLAEAKRKQSMPVVPFPTPAPTVSLPLRFFGECRHAAPTRYHVKGLLAEGATSSLYGDPKTLKSTLAVDIGVHLAAGKEWRGHRIREARGVVYFAFERWKQVEKALVAYAIRDGHRDLPFAIVPRLVNMLDQGCSEIVAATVRAAEQRFGLPVGLAVFDTWSKGIAAGGGDEDRAQDQNAAAANLRRIIEALPAIHCLTIGHTGKDAAKGERGSNATKGDRDVGMLVKGNGRIKTVMVDYANDLPDGELTAFEGEPIVVGSDEDGEPVTGFVVSQRAVAGMPDRRKRTERQQLAMNALELTIRDHGQDAHGVRAVPLDRWRAELHRRGILDSHAKNPRTDFKRLKDTLTAANEIAEYEGRVWLAATPGFNPTGINMPPFPPSRP